MTYKFYKSLVTGAGYAPQGHCLATLTLDENRTPTWSEVDPEFERLCLPWFDNTVRMGVIDNLPPLKPYSEEALKHLSKHQLPSQGFMMMEIKAPTSKAAPPAVGFQLPPSYSPPPGLINSNRKLD